MTSYFITPFDPNINPNGEANDIELRIAPEYYRQQLLLKWPATKILESSADYPLQWDIRIILKDGKIEPCGIGELYKDLQIVSVDTPYEEYFLWHRGMVPARYKLFLFNDSDITKCLELLPATTIEIIKYYCGRRGF